MQQLNQRHARHFNKARSRTGALCEGRYGSSLIATDRQFFTAVRYIEFNPVRARMVGHPEEYSWSGFRQNSCGSPGDVIRPHPLYESLGRSPDDRGCAYRRLFELPEDADALEVIRSRKVI